MMNCSLKKFLVCGLFAISCLASLSSVRAEIDDFDFDLDDIMEVEASAPARELPGLDDNIKYDDVVLALVASGITEPLWTNTRAPAGRDILHLFPHKLTSLERGGCALSYFFNMTDDMQVTAGDLFNPSVINNVLTNLLPQLDVELAKQGIEGVSEISSLVPIFKKLTIQERKTGFDTQFGFTWHSFLFQVHSSLYLGERNFWLSPTDEAAVRAKIIEIFGEGNEFDESEMFRIRVGAGDTRFKIGLNTINMTNWQLDCGLSAILPTSQIFNSVDLKTDQNDIFKNAKTNADLLPGAINALRNIRDYLIKPRLGNNHFGLGCFLESKITIFSGLAQLWTRIAYDKLFEAKEDLLIMPRPVVTTDDLISVGGIDCDDPEEFASGTQLLDDFLHQYVLPPAYKATVAPGGIFNFVTSLSFDVDQFRFVLGYDFYAQQRERVRKIHSCECVSIDELRVEDAVRPEVRQHKIFSQALWKFKETDNADMSVGLGFDYTIEPKNIGADWTAYIKFVALF